MAPPEVDVRSGRVSPQLDFPRSQTKDCSSHLNRGFRCELDARREEHRLFDADERNTDAIPVLPDRSGEDERRARCEREGMCCLRTLAVLSIGKKMT